MPKHNIVISLEHTEMEALREIARRERRTLKEQVVWLIAQAAAEALLLHDVGMASFKPKEDRAEW